METVELGIKAKEFRQISWINGELHGNVME
jgi:hypothetical protein